MMTDLTDIMPIKVRDLSTGSLFVPVEGGDEYFLAGRINDTPVLITLDGEEPFHVAETKQWGAVRRGVSIGQVRYEGDLESAFKPFSEDEAPPGTLVRSSGAVGIVGFDKHQRYTIWLLGTEDRGVGQDDVAFGKWQIVAGSKEKPTILFEHERPAPEQAASE